MRPIRLVLALTLLALTAVGLLVRPAATLAVSDSAYPAFKTVGAGHTYPNGAWGITDGCDVGIGSGQEYRCAAEFDMSNIPSSAKILSAVLALKKTAGCPANDCSVDLAIYAGNGNDDLGDVLQGSVAATFSPGSTLKQFNVVGQVQDQISNGGDYFGIRLSRNASTGDSAVQSFGIADFKLTVSYVNRPVDVNVTLGGLGQGTVTSDPAGVDCGSTCTWWFEWLEPITLTASPQNGGTFDHWEGDQCDGSTNAVCAFDVPALPVNVTAVFDAITPPVSAPPKATPTPQLTPPPLTPAPTTRASAGPPPTAIPAPTDVIAPDGTIITPAPATLEPGATPAPTIVGLGSGDATGAATSGGVVLPVLIVLILVLGAVVGGGVYWFAKRREGIAP